MLESSKVYRDIVRKTLWCWELNLGRRKRERKRKRHVTLTFVLLFLGLIKELFLW